MQDPYFDSKALSKSAIDKMLKSPTHYKAWLDDKEEKKDTPACIFGRMVHKATLEPENFDKEFAVTSLNLATKEGIEWKSTILQERTIIKEPEHKIALQIADAVRNHHQAKHLFNSYKAEQSIYWTRPDGIECKCKPDLVSLCDGVRIAGDVKTTEDASPEGIARSVAKYHYYRQASWYLSGLSAVGQECSYFVFIFVEKKFPFLVTPCILDEEALEKGRDDCERAVSKLKECREKNMYPDYSHSDTGNLLTISLPHRRKKEI